MSNRPNASRFQLILRIRRRALKRQPRARLQLSRLTCSAISGAMIVRAQTPARAVLSARRGVTCLGHWRCRCISSSGPSDASRVWCSGCQLPEDDRGDPWRVVAAVIPGSYASAGLTIDPMPSLAALHSQWRLSLPRHQGAMTHRASVPGIVTRICRYLRRFGTGRDSRLRPVAVLKVCPVSDTARRHPLATERTHHRAHPGFGHRATP